MTLSSILTKAPGEGSGTPLQYSCLENPMDGGAWEAAVHSVAESQTQLSDFTFTFHFHTLEKEMATHSSVPAWRIPGTGEPGGLPSMGSHRVRHDWSDLASKQQSLQPHSFHAMAFPKTWDDHNRKKDTNLCCIWVKLSVATQVVCHTSVSRQPWFASGFPFLWIGYALMGDGTWLNQTCRASI